VVLRRLAGHAGDNRALHPPLSTAEQRVIVRPSPDLAYSLVVFDLRAQPLRVRVPVSEPYTSLAGYSTETDNFFAINDREARDGWLTVELFGPDQPVRPSPGARAVRAPSARGLLLVRRVVTSPEAFAAVDAARRASVVEPIAR
jgi:uncharacterized membrane protein